MSRKYEYTYLIGPWRYSFVSLGVTLVFHVSLMSKNHKFLTSKCWKMKVHKPF